MVVPSDPVSEYTNCWKISNTHLAYGSVTAWLIAFQVEADQGFGTQEAQEEKGGLCSQPAKQRIMR